MNIEYFPHFMRSNFPIVANESNEALIEVGEGFKQYLLLKFAGNMDKLEPIWDIDPKTIVMSLVNKDPFRVNGYHPALFIHFNNFIEETL
jgi:hypothetical protein